MFVFPLIISRETNILFVVDEDGKGEREEDDEYYFGVAIFELIFNIVPNHQQLTCNKVKLT